MVPPVPDACYVDDGVFPIVPFGRLFPLGGAEIHAVLGFGDFYAADALDVFGDEAKLGDFF